MRREIAWQYWNNYCCWHSSGPHCRGGAKCVAPTARTSDAVIFANSPVWGPLGPDRWPSGAPSVKDKVISGLNYYYYYYYYYYQLLMLFAGTLTNSEPGTFSSNVLYNIL
jgi:hypothetical protein